MYALVWFWALASAFTPTSIASFSSHAVEAQIATVEAVARPLMTLGWVDEDDAAIF